MSPDKPPDPIIPALQRLKTVDINGPRKNWVPEKDIPGTQLDLQFVPLTPTP